MKNALIYLGIFICLQLSLLLFSCTNSSNENDRDIGADDKVEIAKTKPPATIVPSSKDGNTTYNLIKETLTNVEGIGILGEIEHSANALTAGTKLPFIQTILFGNPKMGTQLMQENLVVGLDLPMKFCVYEEAKTTLISYHNSQYLKDRYGLKNDALLQKMDGALANFAKSGSGKIDSTQEERAVNLKQGIVEFKCKGSFDKVYSAVQWFLEDNSSLSIIAEIDHQANAKSVDMELSPCKLIVFGNPKVGSQLMQSNPAIGLDLPLKLLIFEDENGSTVIAYNEPAFLANRYGISDKSEITLNMSKIILEIVGAASRIESN